MRCVLLAFIATLFLVCGCVQPQVEEEPVPTDPLAAVLYYEKLLETISSASTTSTTKTEELQLQFDGARQALIDSYITEGNLLTGNDTKNPIEAYDEAINLLESIGKWDLDNQLSDEIRSLQAKREVFVEAETKIGNSLQSFKFDQALRDIDAVLSFNPGNAALLNRKTEITNLKRDFANIDQEIASASGAELTAAFDNLQAAVNSLSGAKVEDSPPFATLLDRISEETDTLVRGEKYISAVTLLESFGFEELSGEIRRVKFIAVNAFQQLASQAFGQGNFYLAYLLIHKADSYSTGLIKNSYSVHDQIFELRKTTRDLVDRSIQEHIAIASFDSPGHAPDAGLQFSDALTSHMYSSLPYGINILERDKIDSILAEHKNSEVNAGEILGANLIVTGRVSLFKTEYSEDIRNASVRAQIDEQQVENPEYAQMLRLHGPDENLWPSVPPVTVSKPTYQILQYQKGTARIKGFAKVSVRIFDTTKANITFVKDFPAKIEDVCDFQDEVAIADIPYIPKKLVSSIEAKDAMRNEIVLQIGKVVQSSFDARERRFLNQAKYYLDRREEYKAIEPLAKGYHYCVQDGVPPENAAFMEINRMVNALID